MPDVRQVIEKLKQLKEKKRRKQSRQRIDQLFEKFYHFDREVKIPYPNLYAHAQIEKHFGGLENIDFENDEHLGWLLFILRNQENDILEQYGPQEKEKAVQKILQEIPLNQRERYQRALFEMFIALKKNSLRIQREILQETLEILQS